MAEIGIRELKTHASEIIREVREHRASYLVTYRGQPVGLLLPLSETQGGMGADTEQGVATMEELELLGEEIGRGWQTSADSATLLSDMRR